MARNLAAALAVLLLSAPSWARAHPDVDEGRRLAQEADLEGALEAFDRAEQSGDLTRADLVSLLEGRALVHHALGDEESLGEAVRALASIAPRHHIGEDLPPAIGAAFHRAQAGSPGRIAVEVAAEPGPGGVSLRARVRDDAEGLAREVLLHVRPPHAGWQVHETGHATVRVAGGESVGYWAEVRGPGGAPIATRGSADEPVVWAPTSAEASTSAPAATGPGTSASPDASPTPAVAPTPRETAEAGIPAEGEGPMGAGAASEDEGDGLPVWPFVVGGAVLVTAGIVVAAVLASEPATQPSFPRHPL